MRSPPRPPNTTAQLIAAGILAYGLHQTWPMIQPHSAPAEWMTYAWGGAALLCAACLTAVLRTMAQTVVSMMRTFRAHRPTVTDASSDWLSVRSAKRAGLQEQQGWFLGLLEHSPLFVKDAVHVLICAPSRKGKTTGAVMTNLLHDTGTSMLVTDMNGNLAFQTAEHRQNRLGHRIIQLNPARKFGMPDFRYNPVQLILDPLENSPQDAVSTAWGMARQIYPVAPGGDREPFWPNGTRKLIVFGILAVAVYRPKHQANLPYIYQVISDDRLLREMIEMAKSDDRLAGEISILARNIETTWDTNPKHLESFREGALQSLMQYGPSGRLAESVMSCSFRFFELKREKITAYLICDQSRMEEYAGWMGLLVWCAKHELSREPNNIQVQFLLDEFTNLRLDGLPNMLTGLAALDIRCIILVQELREIVRVYGVEALATVLSQCDVKQFFGFASHDTAQLVSRMLGDRELAGESFTLAHDLGGTPGLSINKAAKPLMTAEELRRLDDDEQIVFIRNLRPARLRKVGYHEVHPWRTEYVKPDPIHGGKPFLGKVKVKVSRGMLRATWRGTKRIKRIKRPLLKPIFAALAVAVPTAPPLMLIAAIGAIGVFGSPHVIYWYEYSMRGNQKYYHVCNYAGLPIIGEQFEFRYTDHCPIVIWKKFGGTQQ